MENNNVFKFDPDTIITSGTTYTLNNSPETMATISTTSSNCIAGGSLVYPYYPYTTAVSYSYPQNSDIQLKKAENGWILYKGGLVYVLKSPDEVVKYMKEDKSK